jgi:hypothetical protein
MNSDITEQYINQIYDNLQREQFKLMNDIKGNCDEEKSKNIQKQVTLINSINLNLLKLRNVRTKKNKF